MFNISVWIYYEKWHFIIIIIKSSLQVYMFQLALGALRWPISFPETSSNFVAMPFKTLKNSPVGVGGWWWSLPNSASSNFFFFALKLGKGGQNFLGGSECGANELRERANSCPAELLWQEKRVPKLAREVYAELPDNDL